MLYYIVIRYNSVNKHCWKILRGIIDHEERDFIVLDTDEGMVGVHRSQLHETYDSAREAARMAICEEFGEEL